LNLVKNKISDSSPVRGDTTNPKDGEEKAPFHGTYNQSNLESMCSLDMSHLTFLTNDKVAASIPFNTNNLEMKSQRSNSVS